MTPLQARFQAVIQALGDEFTTGGATRIGLLTLSRRFRDHLPDWEVEAANRPIRALYVPYDDPTPLGAGVTTASSAWIVKKVTPLRHRNETVAKILILVP